MENTSVGHRLGGMLAVFFLLVPWVVSAQTLRDYDTPYYVIHTDLQGDDLREAQVRMTRMFET